MGVANILVLNKQHATYNDHAGLTANVELYKYLTRLAFTKPHGIIKIVQSS